MKMATKRAAALAVVMGASLALASPAQAWSWRHPLTFSNHETTVTTTPIKKTASFESRDAALEKAEAIFVGMGYSPKTAKAFAKKVKKPGRLFNVYHFLTVKAATKGTEGFEKYKKPHRLTVKTPSQAEEWFHDGDRVILLNTAKDTSGKAKGCNCAYNWVMPVSSGRKTHVASKKPMHRHYRRETTPASQSAPVVAASMAAPADVPGCSMDVIPGSLLDSIQREQGKPVLGIKGYLAGPASSLRRVLANECTASSVDGGKTWTKGLPNAICSNPKTGDYACDFSGSLEGLHSRKYGEFRSVVLLAKLGVWVHKGPDGKYPTVILRLPPWVSNGGSLFVPSYTPVVWKVNYPKDAAGRMMLRGHNYIISNVGWSYYHNRKAVFGPESDNNVLHFKPMADWATGQY